MYFSSRDGTQIIIKQCYPDSVAHKNTKQTKTVYIYHNHYHHHYHSTYLLPENPQNE